MQVVSVNVALPRAIAHGGETVRTGIFKQPVAGPVHVGPTRLEGDDQADPGHHGGVDKAVYAFAQSQYAHWQQTLGRGPMPAGQFGENLTIDGLDEADCRIGDRWHIGDVALEVTQPRIPCFKLGIRMQQPDMPQRFTAHGWPGVYLRVTQTGALAAGDTVKIVHRAPDSVSIRDLFRACMDPRGDDAVLHRALAVPGLAAEMRARIERRLGRR